MSKRTILGDAVSVDALVVGGVDYRAARDRRAQVPALREGTEALHYDRKREGTEALRYDRKREGRDALHYDRLGREGTEALRYDRKREGTEALHYG